MGFTSVKMKCMKFVVVLTAVMVAMGGSAIISSAEYVSGDSTKSVAGAGSSDIGYAVLVAGDAGFKERWWVTKNAETAYNALRDLGFDDERILYLSNNPKDVDGDGHKDVDKPSSDDDFEFAMVWARERVEGSNPFILYLVGHGEKDEFYLNISDSLHVTNLGQELDKFPEETRMLIVIDACNSGSFITDPNNISAKNRIIVASVHDDKKVYPFLSARFSFYFWLHLLQGEDVRQSFIEGTKDANHKITGLWYLALQLGDIKLIRCHIYYNTHQSIPWLSEE